MGIQEMFEEVYERLEGNGEGQAVERDIIILIIGVVCSVVRLVDYFVRRPSTGKAAKKEEK